MSPDTSLSGVCLYASRKSINTRKTYTFLTFFSVFKIWGASHIDGIEDLDKYTIDGKKNTVPQQSDVLDYLRHDEE